MTEVPKALAGLNVSDDTLPSTPGTHFSAAPVYCVLYSIIAQSVKAKPRGAVC